jgi:hypothetical protein
MNIYSGSELHRMYASRRSADQAAAALIFLGFLAGMLFGLLLRGT